MVTTLGAGGGVPPLVDTFYPPIKLTDLLRQNGPLPNAKKTIIKVRQKGLKICIYNFNGKILSKRRFIKAISSCGSAGFS
jgi:hypothetical protein